mmetsp:Transcript_16530/g.37228  ORF Transcript_16530/g.37228 Transcript_16530/m.37228 type:complete len:335 (+) Transcript_16530:244-1248(+)
MGQSTLTSLLTTSTRQSHHSRLEPARAAAHGLPQQAQWTPHRRTTACGTPSRRSSRPTEVATRSLRIATSRSSATIASSGTGSTRGPTPASSSQSTSPEARTPSSLRSSRTACEASRRRRAALRPWCRQPSRSGRKSAWSRQRRRQTACASMMTSRCTQVLTEPTTTTAPPSAPMPRKLAGGRGWRPPTGSITTMRMSCPGTTSRRPSTPSARAMSTSTAGSSTSSARMQGSWTGSAQRPMSTLSSIKSRIAASARSSSTSSRTPALASLARRAAQCPTFRRPSLPLAAPSITASPRPTQCASTTTRASTRGCMRASSPGQSIDSAVGYCIWGR